MQLGEWLRDQRRARGWAVREMARRLHEAATDSGDRSVPSVEALTRNIRRWESRNGGTSERYRLYYGKALGIQPAQFVPPLASEDEQAEAEPTATSRQWLAALLRDIRDGFRDDAKQCQARAEQVAHDPVRAALCRGQALGYTAAAEHVDAALVSSTVPRRHP